MKTISFLLACAMTPFLASAQFCFCSYEVNPVCGSDGNTYINPCYFWCSNLIRIKEEKVTMVCETACGTPSCSSPKLSLKKKLSVLLGPNPLKK